MPREQWWHAPAAGAGLRGAAEGANRAPLHVHTLGLSDNLCVGASCPQNLGVPALLGIEFCQSFNLCKVLFRSQPAEDGQVTPPSLACSLLMVVARFKVGNQVR